MDQTARKSAPFIVGDYVEIKILTEWHLGVVTSVMRNDPPIRFGIDFTLIIQTSTGTIVPVVCGEEHLGPHLRPAPPEE